MHLQTSLSIIQYNARESRDQVMMPFFDNPRTLTYDIIAFQEPWRNAEFFTTYHPQKDIFHLIYMENPFTRVCFFINKRLAASSWYATHHSPDLCTISLQLPSLEKLHIHNIHNPIIINNAPGHLPLLSEKLATSPLDEHIILGDFNLHHPAWGGIGTKIDNDSEVLLAVVEQYGVYLLLKTGTSN